MNTIQISEIDLNNGYYHFTNIKNVESISINGLVPTIGPASKMVGDKENVSVSKGAKGMIGVINSFLYVLQKKRVCDIPVEFRKYFNDITNFECVDAINLESLYRAYISKLKDEIYLYVRVTSIQLENALVGGLTGYDIKLSSGIDSGSVYFITDDAGKIMSAYDVALYIYKKTCTINVFREFHEKFYEMFETFNLVKNKQL